MSEKLYNKPKNKYVLPPCPSYDIEGMESWLADMAAKGLVLSKNGFFAGLATFEKTNPCSMRYRLDVVPNNAGIWADTGDEPSEEAVELSETYGWKYVAKRGQFYIYCTETSNARELNTDPQVQALALDLVRKRERRNVIVCFIWLMVFPILQHRSKLLLTVVHTGFWFMLGVLFLVLWSLGSSITQVVHLRKLRKKLALGETPNHEKNWKHYAIQYRLSGIVYLIFVLTWLGFLLHGFGEDISHANVQSLVNYKEDLPFITIADLAPNGTYHINDLQRTNTIETRSDLLAPMIIEYNENASVTLENGKYLKGGLLVDYYETIAPWLAREIAREYKAEAKNSKFYEELGLIDLDIDYAFAYMEYFFPTVIMQEGNKVMCVKFYQTSENYTMEFNEWAQAFANSLK